ncbi:MAG: phosphatidate cytidylyltransferase [Deltaproteobacteria bacterium]|nr:phosphatidate cytidylyltransferase [Deltaproteobacteria bacterium]MBZ0218973.1 phosphatidate cytidylyltransferase [Deltaproteobacteria bacterium]
MEGSLKRVATGAVLIPIIVAIVLYAGPYWILAVSAVIAVLAFSEFNALARVDARDRVLDWLGIVSGLIIILAEYYLGPVFLAPALLAFVFLFFFYSMVSGRTIGDSSIDTAHKTLGLLYIALPISFITPLRELPQGQWWLLFLLVVVWANDTFALSVGKTLGKHKLSPEISPKKTVEGAVGGIIGGIIAAFVFARLAGLGPDYLGITALSAGIGLIAIVGDLAESVLKRSAGVKDSGAIIPGHGGMLDRIDSLIFNIPFVYFYLTFRAMHI